MIVLKTWLWWDNSWFWHYDNTPIHTALILRDHFDKNLTHIVPQPPYSPDLAPCDFWLFSKLKRPLRGHLFELIKENRSWSWKPYQKYFEDWEMYWHKCIARGRGGGILWRRWYWFGSINKDFSKLMLCHLTFWTL